MDFSEGLGKNQFFSSTADPCAPWRSAPQAVMPSLHLRGGGDIRTRLVHPLVVSTL